MLVMSENKHIGFLDSSIRPNLGSKFVDIAFMDSYDPVLSYDLTSHVEINTLRLPITILRRSVRINQFDLSRFTDLSHLGSLAIYESAEKIAQKMDKMINLMASHGAEFEVTQNIARYEMIVTATLNVVDVDLDTSENLFDISMFTPA